MKPVQAEVFIGSVDGVGVESEAEQHGVQAQHLLEIGDDGDGAAFADEGGLPSEFGLQGGRGRLHSGNGAIDNHAMPAVQIAECELHGAGRVGFEVAFDLGDGFVGPLVGDEAHGNLGGGDRRKNRFSTRALIAAPDAVHVERGACPNGLQHGIAGLRARRGETHGVQPRFFVERQLANGVAFVGRELAHVFIEAGNRHAVRFVVKLADEAREDVERILDRTTEYTGVEIAIRALQQDFDVGEAPQAVRHRRNAFTEHGRVGNQDDVGTEARGVLLEERPQMGGAVLFLTLDDELDVHGQVVSGRQIRLNGLHVHVELSLVVARPACVQIAAAHGRIEGRSLPELDGIRRLHVVMPVNKYRRPIVVDVELCHHDRMTGGFDYVYFEHPDAAKLFG